MPGYAKRQIDSGDQRRNEPASPEQMEHRRQVVAELRTLRSRPVTEEEKEFWRMFDEELERERLAFR
jgi:hypothetical protein